MVTARSGAGFTLIELLLTFAIFAILLSLSITSYKDFQNNQVLKQARETLLTNLRFAQSQAFGGVRNCGGSSETLTGWFVSFTNASYTINARCGSAVGNTPRVVPLSPGISLTTNIGVNSILFQPANKEVTLINGQAIAPLSADATVTLTKGSRSTAVTIRKTGDIL